MVYKVIGLMSGSSLDGLDIAYTELHENGGNWSFTIIAAECREYSAEWKEKLKFATELNASDYLLLHSEYGHYLGQQVNDFIERHGLHYQVALIASHGHTTFHLPSERMTAQLGDGAAVAAETGLPVVSDLRALDVALGGQGAPIVPVGEKLLFKDYDLFLNIGGIANISVNAPDRYIAFDVCPANRVLNMLASKDGKDFDSKGELAAMGFVHEGLLQKLNELDYYRQPFPKSLANSFGTDVVHPLIKSFGITHNDGLRTYVEHIVLQIKNAVKSIWDQGLGARLRQDEGEQNACHKLMVTGGGALNSFLMNRLTEELKTLDVELVVADEIIIHYKEALIMALIGVLRWRQEYNTFASVTGAEKDSIGGAVWTGQEA